MEIAGKKVVNATKPLLLNITKSDCAHGNVKDPGACAAALALKRQLHVKKARVHLGRVYVEMETQWVRYNTPQSLKHEIISFDRGGSFEPGEYKLYATTPHQRKGKQQGSNKPSPRKKSVKIARISRHVTTGVRHTLAR
jgi:hypothetical protein